MNSTAFKIDNTADGTITGEDVDVNADSIALPAINGNEATIVLVTVTEDAFIRPGASSLPATLTNANGIALTPESGGIVLNVAGMTHIHHIRSAADGRITITALR